MYLPRSILEAQVDFTGSNEQRSTSLVGDRRDPLMEYRRISEIGSNELANGYSTIFTRP